MKAFAIKQGVFYLVPMRDSRYDTDDFYSTTDPKEGSFYSRETAERAVKRLNLKDKYEIVEVDV